MRVEVPPLTRDETSALIESSVAQGHIQTDARSHVAYLHQLSKGIPRVLEELLIELASENITSTVHSDATFLSSIGAFSLP
ncbi:MAG: hypothetical protein JO232_01710 [Verrucomicrobia bacterium]|nr:hypothetical protein [Verrucomicrobiota bacterium]